MELIKLILTSVISISEMFLMTKLMGKRQISQLSLFDYVNGITVGSIAAELAISPLDECWRPIIATAVYTAASIGISTACNKSLTAREFLVGKPIILFENDMIYEQNLMRAKLDINEFLTCCRTQGYFDLSDIKSAVLETNGCISILPKGSARPLTPDDMNIAASDDEMRYNLVIDGKIMDNCLIAAGRDERWLKNQLAAMKTRVEMVSLATYSQVNGLNVFEKSGRTVESDIFI